MLCVYNICVCVCERAFIHRHFVLLSVYMTVWCSFPAGRCGSHTALFGRVRQCARAYIPPSVYQTTRHLSFISLWFTITFNSCPCLKACVVSCVRHNLKANVASCVCAGAGPGLIARSLHPEATTGKTLRNHNSQSASTAVTSHRRLLERSRPRGRIRQPRLRIAFPGSHVEAISQSRGHEGSSSANRRSS